MPFPASLPNTFSPTNGMSALSKTLQRPNQGGSAAGGIVISPSPLQEHTRRSEQEQWIRSYGWHHRPLMRNNASFDPLSGIGNCICGFPLELHQGIVRVYSDTADPVQQKVPDYSSVVRNGWGDAVTSGSENSIDPQGFESTMASRLDALSLDNCRGDGAGSDTSGEFQDGASSVTSVNSAEVR